jgi:hypothetical protein
MNIFAAVGLMGAMYGTAQGSGTARPAAELTMENAGLLPKFQVVSGSQLSNNR